MKKFIKSVMSSIGLMSDSSLIYAIMDGNSAEVRLLLDKGANVNTENKYGITPLICATDRNIKSGGDGIIM